MGNYIIKDTPRLVCRRRQESIRGANQRKREAPIGRSSSAHASTFMEKLLYFSGR